MHSHSDKKIKTCRICQKNIREIEESGKELDRLGIWSIPDKIEEGKTYTIWKRKK